MSLRTGREWFYSPRDLLAGAITTLVTFLAYLATLAPSVTMEDSGEFLTAAYSLGVPHPPGYPIWTILAWLWCHLIPFGNIAWRINLMSAVFGALACGLGTVLVSKSGRGMMQQVGFLSAEVNQRVLEMVVLGSSVCAGLLLAFSPVMWSQSVIAEVYGLNAFCLMATLVVLYRWSFATEQMWRLYLAAFIWGVGLTAHQTLVLLVVAFPAFVWFSDRQLGRGLLVPILAVIIGAIVSLVFYHESMFYEGLFSAVVLLGIAGGAGYWLYYLWQAGPGRMRRWPQVLAVYGAVILGLSLYGYLYLSSCTNPPMNWGHCSQWEGFRHHFTRGQYDKVHTDRGLLLPHTGDTRSLWGQFNMFFDDLQGQFSLVFALIALLTMFFYRDLGEKDRHWLKFLLISFLCLGLGFIFLSNPTFDKQKQFTDRVFFLPCHCLFALWIGSGLQLGLGRLLSGREDDVQSQKMVAGGLFAAAVIRIGLGAVAADRFALATADLILVALLALLGAVIAAMTFLQYVRVHVWAYALTGLVVCLPLVSWSRNWSNQEQRGHDFGYRFGYLMFKPGGGYPDMEQNAVLFGGTDPGRFVPTYMIFVESFAPAGSKSVFSSCPESATFDRRDVYIITQNALADSTYMAYIRDQYDFSRPRIDDPSSLTNRSGLYQSLLAAAWKPLGRDMAYPAEPIWIPSVQDSQAAFGKYVDELKTRPVRPGEDVRVENGHVSVQGLAGIMTINGYLTKDLFEHNKDQHAFYVEESYVIPWMYPYLEPAGIILKINSEPLAGITPEMFARDTAYWEALVRDLQRDPRFRRDDVAQKAFSKLRSAIGGLYAYRRMLAPAEAAFRQAIELCPDSPEANFRLAQLLLELRRYDDAIQLLVAYQQSDPYNAKILEAAEQITQMKKEVGAVANLEQQLAADPANLLVAMQLARGYATLQQIPELDKLCDQLLAHLELPENEFLGLIQLNAQLNRAERVQQMLRQFTLRFPQNHIGWYNLACVLSAGGNCSEAMQALARALQLAPPAQQFPAVAAQDRRLANCRNTLQYQQLLGQPATTAPAGEGSNLPFKLNP